MEQLKSPVRIMECCSSRSRVSSESRSEMNCLRGLGRRIPFLFRMDHC